MILRFKDPKMTQRFVALCKSRGVQGFIKKEGQWECVRVEIEKKEWKKLIGRWAEISAERSPAK